MHKQDCTFAAVMQKFLFNTLGKGRQYVLSIVVILSVSAICFFLSSFVGYRVVALILLLSVSLLAITFDIWPVIFSAVLSAFIWDIFFIPPRFTIHVNTTEDTILLIMYFVIAMISAVFTYKLKQVEKAANLKEERANSVKLYNTILDSLSHELRTPIAAIIGAADNLQANHKLTDENKEQLVSEISKASLRLNQQVENLLNISRLESGHIKPKNDWCDIVELVYESAKRVEENNAKRKINISINPSLPLCYLDKGMLEQIIYNLLNNAAVHTDPASKITISASCPADLLEIIIEDNGKGFIALDMKEALDKFSRTKNPKVPGSGLGLSIVKGFTEALGGTVELTKPTGGGAKFSVLIPVRISNFKVMEE